MVTQMAEEDVPQAVVPELPDGEGALIIAQMAVSLADTHLELVGIWPEMSMSMS